VATDRVIYPPIESRADQQGRSNPAHGILTVAASVAVIGAAASVGLAIWSWCSVNVTLIYLVLPFWIVGPPVWFWFDYFKVYRRYGDPEAFDSYKHGQQISIAIWAAFALLFAALANADHFKTKAPTLCCACTQVEPAVPSAGHGADTSPDPEIKSTEEPASAVAPSLPAANPDSAAKTPATDQPAASPKQ
jgi:hypothetical protein